MSDRKAVFILLVLLTGILLLVFDDVFLHPNQYLFGTIGDGIKNYFTFAWYVKFDSGLHFSGMNYPFGEHIVYTDNQPFFSVPLRLIHQYLFPLDKHIFGIINSIIFLSILASGVVLYFILKKYLLPAWFAIIGAVLIVLLSPQHYFISQQYALTNTLVLPAIWLTVICIFEAPGKINRHFWYGLIMVAAGFVHPYFPAMGALLFFGYWLWHMFQLKSLWYRNLLHKGLLLLCGAFPLLLFKLFLVLTDTIADRPESPRHVLEGKANLAGLFYPVNSFSAFILNAVLPGKVPVEESHGYLGLAAFLYLVSGVLIILKNRSEKRSLLKLPVALNGGIWAGLLILLFAMSIPFQFGLAHWLDHIPVLKQFRFTSRFSWMFYYVFTATALYLAFQIFRFYERAQKKKTAINWLIFILLLWSAEAFSLLRVEASILKTHKLTGAFTSEEENVTLLLKQAGRRPTDFQMLIPIPYYSDGSEKIGERNWGETMYQSMKVAYQTGIPISPAALSRTSLKQTLLRTQLLSSDSIQKEILPLLPNRKPILVVVTDSAEKKYEKRLIQKSKFLIRHKNVAYYELPLASLENIYRDPVRPEHLKIASVPQNVVYQTFSNKNSEKWLYRKGVFYAETGPVVLFENTLPRASAAITYEFSVWVNATSAIGIPVIKLEEINTANKVVNQQIVNLRDATEIYKDWLKVTICFKLRSAKNRVKISAEGKDILADELIIRPVKQPFYFYTEDRKQLIRNNYAIPVE